MTKHTLIQPRIYFLSSGIANFTTTLPSIPFNSYEYLLRLNFILHLPNFNLDTANVLRYRNLGHSSHLLS